MQDKYEGTKGHMLLQLQKSYKLDDRFRMTDDFDFDPNMVKN